MSVTNQNTRGRGRTGDLAGLGEGVAPRQRRGNHRVDFVRKATAICVNHPGGSVTNCVVNTLDLSASGIRFVYGNFLHVGTVVVITLGRHRGGEEKVVGTVIRCTYKPGGGHEIGVRFKQPIFPQLFVDPSQWEELYEAPVVKAEDLAGTVLLLEDQEMDRDLFEHLLKRTKVKLTAVGTLEDAITAVQKEQFQAVCIDVNLGTGKLGGEEAGKKLREAGFKGQFVVCSVEPVNRAKVARSLGTTSSLGKPFERTQLLYTLASAMQVLAEETVDPIYSSLEDRAHSKALLERFVKHAQRTSVELHRLVELSDFAGVRLQCQSLRGTAGGYGFQPLADAATKAVSALDAGGAVADAEAELQVLQTLCRRLTAEEPK